MGDESTHRLIEHVRQLPCVWDPRIVDGKGGALTADAWTAIADGLVEGFADMPRLRRAEEVANLMDKWMTVHNDYVSFKQWSKQGNATGIVMAQYAYADKLSFLDPVIPDKGGFIRTRQIAMRKAEAKAEAEKPSPPALPTEDNFLTEAADDIIERCDPGSRIQDEVEKDLWRFIAASMRPKGDDDPDRCFLMSILSDVQQLSAPKKLKFREAVLRLLIQLNGK